MKYNRYLDNLRSATGSLIGNNIYPMDNIQIAQIQNIPQVLNVLKVLVTGLLAFFLAF